MSQVKIPTVLNKLLEIDPAAFERLIQRLLRESGFVQVLSTKIIEVEKISIDQDWFDSL